jgi:hypothetical protein
LSAFAGWRQMGGFHNKTLPQKTKQGLSEPKKAHSVQKFLIFFFILRPVC